MLGNVFFPEWFWLSANGSWKDFENDPDDGLYIPQFSDLLVVVPTALTIFVVRTLFERFIAYPFGHYMGISSHISKAPSNPKLEDIYRKISRPRACDIQLYSTQLDIPERVIQRWFRKRQNQHRQSAMTKFTETAWRGFFYLLIFAYGLSVLWNKSWFSDVKNCWLGHPRQHIDREIYWYYMIELGFYVCLLFSQFADVRRKDFWEQFVHHLATIFLMCFSWIVNFVRVGSLILCLHDAVDYLLEGAKLTRYLNYRVLCDSLFVIFMFTWFGTRLVLYPYVILYTTGVDSVAIAGYSHAIALLNVLLWVLQVLHIFWFMLIIKVAYRAIVDGKVEKDVRSDSEVSENENDTNFTNIHNGYAAGYNGIKSE